MELVLDTWGYKISFITGLSVGFDARGLVYTSSIDRYVAFLAMVVVVTQRSAMCLRQTNPLNDVRKLVIDYHCDCRLTMCQTASLYRLLCLRVNADRKILRLDCFQPRWNRALSSPLYIHQSYSQYILFFFFTKILALALRPNSTSTCVTVDMPGSLAAQLALFYLSAETVNLTFVDGLLLDSNFGLSRS